MFSVKRMCDCLGVTRSSYYDWREGASYLPKEEEKILLEKIETIFNESRQTDGTRRIKRALFREDLSVSRRRIARLMKKKGLSCKTKPRYQSTTNSKHSLPVSDNLLNRQFNVDSVDTHYVGDITYIGTQEGWLYLAAVIDLFSRNVVGWNMKDHMRAELVNDALLMALWKRKPEKGLLWHSDRGAQYASESHRQILQEHGISQSMSRKGNCWDNAVSESFFHTLKTELTHGIQFKTKEEAKKAIFEYIEVFYNRVRMHSANDYLSPIEFENAQNF